MIENQKYGSIHEEVMYCSSGKFSLFQSEQGIANFWTSAELSPVAFKFCFSATLPLKTIRKEIFFEHAFNTEHLLENGRF